MLKAILHQMRFKETIWHKISLYGLEFIGKYYSNYRAFVVNNEDPLGMGRLQLLIPHLNPTTPDETWAFPKNVWGGDNYGVQMLPQKTDLVWVEFENGDPDFPVWSHAGYAENEKPSEFETTKHYGFKTPRGTLVVVNDNKDQEEILVKLNNKGEWIKINKEQLEVEAKLIKLGVNGDEQSVLGNTLKEKMDSIMDKIDATYDALLIHKHPAPMTPPSPEDVTQFTKLKVEMKVIKTEFEQYLSDKVKIDK